MADESNNSVGQYISYRVMGQNNEKYLDSKEYQNLIDLLEKLICDRLIQILPPEAYPFTNRVGFPNLETQKLIIRSKSSPDCFLYPTPKILQKHIDKSKFNYSPYGLLLALCKPKLSFVCFELQILEHYRNDPRFEYEDSGVEGRISAKDEFSDELEKFVLERFTYAINKTGKRYVAVFLMDLARLPKNDQTRWKLSEINEQIQVHPDFVRRYLEGEWGNSISIITAILLQISITNQLCLQIGKERLFTAKIEEDLSNAPKEFMFLLRPTQKSYYEFIITLEKLTCNLNYKFFARYIDTHEEIYNSEGNVEKKPIGTITLLDNWARKCFPDLDQSEWSKVVIDTLRNIRRERQTPAHKIANDEFDYKFYDKQKQLLEATYDALNFIRVACSMIPGADQSSIQQLKHLKNSKIYPI